MLRVKWQLTEVLSFVSHYFEILIHALITSLLVSYNLFKGRLSQTSAGPKCLLTGTKTKMIFFQIEKRLLYVFKRFMVLPLFTWLTCGIVSPPLRHSGWQVNLCWSSPYLGGSWEATPPSQLLCQGCGIPYTFSQQPPKNSFLFFGFFSLVLQERLRCIVSHFFVCFIVYFLFYLWFYWRTALWHSLLL